MWWQMIRNLISNRRVWCGHLELMSSMISAVEAGYGARAWAG